MQQAEPLLFEFSHPAFVDFVKRYRVDEMQLFPPTPDDGQQIGGLQYPEVLGGGLPGHVEAFAKLAERLPVLLAILMTDIPSAIACVFTGTYSVFNQSRIASVCAPRAGILRAVVCGRVENRGAGAA